MTRMPARFLLVDVDNTLYSRAYGVIERVDALIDCFLVERLGITPAEVGAVRGELRRVHGTTLRGLMHERAIDADEYLRFVHCFDVAEILAPDPALQAMLARIPLPKVSMTNAPTAHAHAVLDRLGVRDCFLRVYALEQLDYVPKPLPEAFATVLEDLAAAPADCILVEDSPPNLATARALGMRTVHVAEGAASAPGAEVTIGSILELEAALARLEAH